MRRSIIKHRVWTVGAVAVITALVVAVFGFAPPASATNRTACGNHHDFFQLWTEYHGYPVCYANAGTIYYGEDPPRTTWSVSDVCAGANQAEIHFYYWVDGRGWWPAIIKLYYWECRHLRQEFDGEVEVSYFDLFG